LDDSIAHTFVSTAVSSPWLFSVQRIPIIDRSEGNFLKSPGGIAFFDFKGYEDWAVVSSARTDEVLKVIVANPTMISAYKPGIPGNGQPFPDGSTIVKLRWKPRPTSSRPIPRASQLRL
jgi:hypothetical protein